MRMTRLAKCRNERKRRLKKRFFFGFFVPVMIALISYLTATLFILPLLAK